MAVLLLAFALVESVVHKDHSGDSCQHIHGAVFECDAGLSPIFWEATKYNDPFLNSGILGHCAQACANLTSGTRTLRFGYGNLARCGDGYCCEHGFDSYRGRRLWSQHMKSGANKPIRIYVFSKGSSARRTRSDDVLF